MNRTTLLLCFVLLISILGIACITISVVTNSWLRIDIILGPNGGSTIVGLWKTCVKNNLATDCMDVLMSTPIILILIGLSLVLLAVIVTTVVIIFRRLLSIVALVAVIFFLMATAFLLSFLAVYWFQMLNVIFRQYLTNVIVSTSEISIGYSCALLFIGLGLIILSISIASFVAGSQVSIPTMKLPYQYPMTAGSLQHYSYF